MVPRRVRLLLALLALALARPTVVAGQTRTWDNYCTVGLFQACFSIEASFIVVPAPWDPTMFASSISVSIRNLQGFLGTNEPWGLQGLTFAHLGTDPALVPPNCCAPVTASVPATLEGNAGSVGLASRLPGLNGWWDVNNQGLFVEGRLNRSTQIGDGAWPIAGCSPLAPDPVYGLYHFEIGYLWTCGDGWVKYSFIGPVIQFTNSTTVTVSGYRGNPSTIPEGMFSCVLGVDCVSTTPEPSSFALVGTALIVLIGLSRRLSFRARPARSTQTG